MTENEKTTKDITTDEKKLILGYFELQISFQNENPDRIAYWVKDNSQYVHDLITADIQQKENKILEMIERFEESKCPRCGKQLERNNDPMNPLICHPCRLCPSIETHSWFEEILKIYRENKSDLLTIIEEESLLDTYFTERDKRKGF